MKRKIVGIVGGAGPLAGAMLLERIIRLAATRYGCYRDADFPEVILISYPFSDMLDDDFDVKTIREELSGCLSRLKQYGADIAAIACNTLHVFLDESGRDGRRCGLELVHLPHVISERITACVLPVVLCTATSRRYALHKRFFPCVYPAEDAQKELDNIIKAILKGDNDGAIINRLSALIGRQKSQTVVLGCSELSLYGDKLLASGKTILDPLEVSAEKILEKLFLNK